MSGDDAVNTGDEERRKRNILSPEEVARRFQKMTDVEHVLKRPDTYTGSIERETETRWVLREMHAEATEPNEPDEPDDDEHDDETKIDSTNVVQRKRKAVIRAWEHARMELREVSYVPALLKIVDEILVNAADNTQRSLAEGGIATTVIKVDIDAVTGRISVWNNGRGLPVTMHPKEEMYVPTLVFGELRSGSRFNDDEKRTTGGRNGYGAKLCNIFSSEFAVEIHDSGHSASFKQRWSANMSKRSEPRIKPSSKPEKADFTRVTFIPDFVRFGIHPSQPKNGGEDVWLDDDHMALLRKRVYDLAGTMPRLRVFLNGKRIDLRGFSDYVSLYLGPEAPRVYEALTDRCQVCVALCGETSSFSGSVQQMSFVNGIWTVWGGRHVDVVVEQLVPRLVEALKKKKVVATPALVRSHLFVFVNAVVINPSFDTQTKTTLTTKKAEIAKSLKLSEKFLTKLSKSDLIPALLQAAEEKAARSLKKSDGKKVAHDKMKVDKLEDATLAGTRHSDECTIIFTEGDSAKALAMAGLSVVGRKTFGVFPLRGKVTNAAAPGAVDKNAEFQSIVKILGLKHAVEYTDTKSLRYGHVLIMTDQDHDGSHIKGLLINLFEQRWPSLLKIPGFLAHFRTPIVKVSKRGSTLAFYALPDYEKWKHTIAGRNGGGWTIKYYKGLGTSTAAEGKEYFRNLRRNRIAFEWTGDADRDALRLAFGKQNADARKRWLADAQRNKVGHDDAHRIQHEKLGGDARMSYWEFVHKELVLYSIASNVRAIPLMVDGFKPSQRKIMWVCLGRNQVREIKVASLAGGIIEQAAYHHGEQSLCKAIVWMAQDYVGSNNINLLLPGGQFGTRAESGADSASPRYILTRLSPLARLIFRPEDDAILTHLTDDGKRIEPEFFLPIIPMVLINGCNGIGTGWRTSIPPTNPTTVILALAAMIRGDSSIDSDLAPWSRGFLGTIVQVEAKPRKSTNEAVPSEGVPSMWMSIGKIEPVVTDVLPAKEHKFLITEIPLGKSISNFKAHLQKMRDDDQIEGIEDESVDDGVRFTITLTDTQRVNAEKIGLTKYFRLEERISTNDMVLWRTAGELHHYHSLHEILRAFYEFRLPFYERRKQSMIAEMQARVDRISHQVRFIRAVVSEEIKLRNVPKLTILRALWAGKFPLVHSKIKDDEEDNGDDDDDNETKVDDTKEQDNHPDERQMARGYGYLMKLPLWSITLEQVNQLQKEQDDLREQLDRLAARTSAEMWLADLDELSKGIMDVERERQEQLKPTASAAIRGRQPTDGGKRSSMDAKTTSAAPKRPRAK